MTDDRHERGMYLNDVLARSEARIAADLRAATDPPADPLAAAREALVLYATTTRTVTADALAPLIDRLVEAAGGDPCPCYPNPSDHEDYCPRRQP